MQQSTAANTAPTPAPNSETNPVRAVIVGYGSIAEHVHIPLIESTNGIELVGVVSRHPERVHEALPDIPTADSLAEAVEQFQPEVAIITTPNVTHRDLAIEALNLGLHALVEKPFTLDTHEAQDVLDAAHRADRIVTVFQNRQFDSDFLGIRQLIDSGELGEIKSVYSNYDRYRPNVRDRWREDGALGSGIWYDLGPHLIDQAIRLFGIPGHLFADLVAQREGSKSVDWFNVTLMYGTTRVILHADSFEAGRADRWIVRGRSKTAYKHLLDAEERQFARGLRPGDDGWGEDPDPLVVVDGATGEVTRHTAPAGCEEQLYAMLVDAIRHGGRPAVTEPEALAVMAILDAGLVSSAEGRVVALQRQAP